MFFEGEQKTFGKFKPASIRRRSPFLGENEMWIIKTIRIFIKWDHQTLASWRRFFNGKVFHPPKTIFFLFFKMRFEYKISPRAYQIWHEPLDCGKSSKSAISIENYFSVKHNFPRFSELCEFFRFFRNDRGILIFDVRKTFRSWIAFLIVRNNCTWFLALNSTLPTPRNEVAHKELFTEMAEDHFLNPFRSLIFIIPSFVIRLFR